MWVYYLHILHFTEAQVKFETNKSKMAKFLKLKFLITLKLSYMGSNFINKKSRNGYFICIVKFEVENCEHLCSNSLK